MIICARELNSWRTRHGVSSLCEFTLQPSLVYSASTPNTRPDPGEAWPARCYFLSSDVTLRSSNWVTLSALVHNPTFPADVNLAVTESVEAIA